MSLIMLRRWSAVSVRLAHDWHPWHTRSALSTTETQ
jgi:hypothetical protein